VNIRFCHGAGSSPDGDPQADDAWRVATSAFRYRLALLGGDAFRIHLAPGGQLIPTPTCAPRPGGSGGDTPLTTMKEHLPRGRLTFESAVEWAVETGVPAVREDWREVIGETRDRHVLHRSWSTFPPILQDD
jgi:hypothetical protein